MIILLDLNYTLVANSADKASPSEHRKVVSKMRRRAGNRRIVLKSSSGEGNVLAFVRRCQTGGIGAARELSRKVDG